MADDYDRHYGSPEYFGAEPSRLLIDHAGLVPYGSRVLDIGSGQGRNALYLADQGCRVTGIDTSATAVKELREAAGGRDIDLNVLQADYREYEPEAGFDVVLCFGLIQILSPAEGASLIDRLTHWTRRGGALFMTGWHVGDPGFAELRETWSARGSRCFVSADGSSHRLFLNAGEILGFFPGWKVHHHWEGLGPVHSHAGGPAERHGDVEAVLVRP